MTIVLSKTPKEQSEVVGHEAVLAQLKKVQMSDQLPHAILFAGRRGVGKATLAWQWIKHLLCPPTHGDCLYDSKHAALPLLLAGSHPDLFVLEAKEGDTISVESVSTLHRFMEKTPVMAPYKIVLIDSLDGLNRFGANKLLKLLEEPPGHVYFLLISHNYSGVLPTIRSRCQTVALKPIEDLCNFPGYEKLSLLQKTIVGGYPGVLAAFEEDSNFVEALDLILNFFTDGAQDKRIDITSIKKLAEVLKSSYWARQAFSEILHLCCKIRAVGPDEFATVVPEILLSNIPDKPLATWLQVWDNWQQLQRDALVLNLDWEQILLRLYCCLIEKPLTERAA